MLVRVVFLDRVLYRKGALPYPGVLMGTRVIPSMVQLPIKGRGGGCVNTVYLLKYVLPPLSMASPLRK